MVVANVNAKTRKVLSGPTYVTKGFYLNKDDEEQLTAVFESVTSKVFTSRFINWVEYKNDLRNDISKVVYKISKNSPMVIPVIISTELEENA